MVNIQYNSERCKGCHLCTIVCPKKIITVNGDINSKGYEVITIDTAHCIACGSCYTICPEGVITIEKEEE